MLRLISPSLWTEIRRACAKAKRRRASLAYVTKDLVNFRKGDLLVVDASKAAIKAGETSAALLLKLHHRGVVLHSRPALHAKVIVADGVAVIGSANMSTSSEKTLVEAAILTDTPQAVSQAASFVEQLAACSQRLDLKTLRKLAKIKVVKRMAWSKGGGPKKPKISLGKNTWLVGVHEEDNTPDDELKFADHMTEEVAKSLKVAPGEVSWIRWTGKSSFALKSRPGDVIIQIWRQQKKEKHPTLVLKAVPVLRRERRGKTTFVFTPEPTGKCPEMAWPKFKTLMARLGYKKISMNTERVLRPNIADAVAASWS